MSESKECEDRRKAVNQAIALPVGMALRSDGGSFFLVRSWSPKVKLGYVIRVEAELIVEMPDGSIASP